MKDERTAEKHRLLLDRVRKWGTKKSQDLPLSCKKSDSLTVMVQIHLGGSYSNLGFGSMMSQFKMEAVPHLHSCRHYVRTGFVITHTSWGFSPWPSLPCAWSVLRSVNNDVAAPGKVAIETMHRSQFLHTISVFGINFPKSSKGSSAEGESNQRWVRIIRFPNQSSNRYLEIV